MVKKRVLQVIGGGEIGGAENHLLNLMRLLSNSEFEPILVCLCNGPFAGQAEVNGITTYTIPMAHPFDISKTKNLRQLITELGINLVHTHGVRANLVARKAAHDAGVPVVTTFHSSLQHDYGSRLAAAAANIVTRLTNRYTSRFIAVSAAIKDYMLTLGIPGDRIDIIYNGIHLPDNQYADHKLELRQALNLPPAAPVIGTVGRLHPVKGHIHLLDAAVQLQKQYPDLYTIIVGDGPEAARYPGWLAERGLTERVIMPGYCPDVNEYYPVMDVFCLPSLMEGQGLVLLEAMSMGVPVVASRVGGIPEVITDGVNGLLVPPADAQALTEAINRLLSKPELRTRLVNHSQETLKHFTLDYMAAQTSSIYNMVLGQQAKIQS